MKSEKKRPLLPKLRFPEFWDAGGWVETSIGDIGSFYYGKSAPKWSLEADAPTKCVRYGELYTKFGVIISETYSRTNIDPKDLRFSKGGEILVPRVGEKPDDFGKCCCYLPLGNIAIGEMISVFETTQNPLFYTYYFRNLYRQFAKVVEGQNVKNLYYVELEPLSICRPSLPEQQKIADCLSSLDDLITLEAQKLDTLKTHKKGLMQKLFPAEGESLPKLRFPEFRDAGEWKEYYLSDVALEKLSNGVFNDPKKVGNGYKLVNVLDMYIETYIDESKLSLVDIGDAEFVKNKVEHGDIFFTRSSLVKEGIAKSNIYLGYSHDVTFDGHLIRLRPNKNLTLPLFLHFGLRSEAVRLQIVAKGKTATMTTIGQSDIADTKIHIPQEIIEQKKIADCLISIDKLITAQTQKLDTLKTHKKGLMQQLFPSLEEAGA